MRRSILVIIMTTLLLLFSAETAAQSYTLTKSVNAAGDVITYTGSNLDSATTHTTYDGFSLGNFYNFSSYPVEYSINVDTTDGVGNAAQLPKLTLYIDASYDNTNWVEKVDTIVTSDSSVVWHRGTADFNAKAPYYRPTVVSGAGRDSVDYTLRFYFKKE